MAGQKSQNGKKNALTLAKLKKLDSKEYKTKEIKVKLYTLEIDEKLRYTKISDMLKETFAMIHTLQEQKVSFNAFSILLVHMIKYFTSLDVPDSIEDKLNTLMILLDNDMIEPIVSAFDPMEFAKVADTMQIVLQKLNQVFDASKLIDKELRDKAIDEIIAEEEQKVNSESDV